MLDETTDDGAESLEKDFSPRKISSAWDIPESALRVLPNELIRMVVERDPNTNQFLYEPRVRIAAAQALMAMLRHNSGSELDDDDHGRQALTFDKLRGRLAAITRKWRAQRDAEQQSAEGGATTDRLADPASADEEAA